MWTVSVVTFNTTRSRILRLVLASEALWFGWAGTNPKYCIIESRFQYFQSSPQRNLSFRRGNGVNRVNIPFGSYFCIFQFEPHGLLQSHAIKWKFYELHSSACDCSFSQVECHAYDMIIYLYADYPPESKHVKSNNSNQSLDNFRSWYWLLRDVQTLSEIAVKSKHTQVYTTKIVKNLRKHENHRLQ